MVDKCNEQGKKVVVCLMRLFVTSNLGHRFQRSSTFIS